MQTVSNTFKTSLTRRQQSAGVEPSSLTTVVELYKSSAKPTADGFDPGDSANFVAGYASRAGVVFRGVEYSRLLTEVGDVNRTIKKQLSSANFTLSNASREIAEYEKAFGFEGLICVIREIDWRTSVNLNDSCVLFTGRMKRPDEFSRSSETVGMTAEQILNQTEIVAPRRTFSPDDPKGRASSDPLFEGFRYVPRDGAVSFPERVNRGGILGLLGFKKTVQRTLQFSSHSDFSTEQAVPLILGRGQIQFINFASEDLGAEIQFMAIACEGEIEKFVGIHSITPGFTWYDFTDGSFFPPKHGEAGGTGAQLNDDPHFIAAGYYSRTAYVRGKSNGTQLSVDDNAPDLVGIILGLKIPVPDRTSSATSFTSLAKQMSVNPIYQCRWLLNSPDFFNLSDEWFDDADLLNEGDYCDQILVDTTNSNVVQLPTSQTGIAGTIYHNYSSTASVSAAYFQQLSDANRTANPGLIGETYALPADYQFYSNPPLIGDDLNGDGTVDYSAPPTKYVRRLVSNVILSQQMPAYDFLTDILLAGCNGYLVQKATGKLSIRIKKPVDFTFVQAFAGAGALSMVVLNINKFKADNSGSILIGANTPTSEVRKVASASYSTSLGNAVSSTVSGSGITISSTNLAGGSADTAPNATVTILSVSGGAKTLNINGYVLTFSPSSVDDTTDSIAGAMSGLVNSHNVLNKFVKSVWTAGASTFVVSSRIGTLTFDKALEFDHHASIGEPSTAPTVSATTPTQVTFIQAGTYIVNRSFVTVEGETLTSPNATATLTATGQAIHVAGFSGGAAALPSARIIAVNYYCAVEAGGIRTRFAKRVDVADTATLTNGFTITQLPAVDDAIEPVINSTAEELHRVAMAFSDRASTAANLDFSNMAKGSFRFPLGSRQPTTNLVSIKYRDAAQDFALTTLNVKDKANIDKVKKTNKLEIDGSAIDSYNQARRIANQNLAEARDGDLFHAFTSAGEALLLEEGDVICVTEDSGEFRNEPLRIEDITISSLKGFAQAQITARKYRRYYYDDQVAEKIVPLAVVRNNGNNKEQIAPVIAQSGAAANTLITVSVGNYSTSAAYRKIQTDSVNTFNSAALVEFVHSAQNEPGLVLASDFTLTRTTNLSAAETRYVRCAHSSNNIRYGAWSNILAVTFPDSGGTGGTGGGTISTGGGSGTGETGGGGGGGGSCFTAGTMVMTAAFGQSKPIETFKPGDKVMSFNPATLEVNESDTVKEVFVHENVREYLEIELSQSVKKEGVTFILQVTPEHPILTAPGEFTQAGALKKGDVVFTIALNGEIEPSARIESISRVKIETGKCVTVYNLHVEENHTYFADSVLVHNLKDIIVD